MGLFDKLIGHKQEKEANNALSMQTSTDLQDMSEIEKAIAEHASHLSDFQRIPLSEIATLGGMFAQLSPALRTVAQSVTVDGMGYMPINNLGGETLKQFAKDTPGIFAGSFKSMSTGKSTMAQLVKIGPQTVNASSVIPVNPMMMAMAVMMVQVNQKLDAIQKTQQSILSFLQEDKQAKLQGDLNMLFDILDKYKFNWDSEQYRSNYHMKVLDIKQSSEQNIIFYQEQIADKIKGLPGLYLDQVVRDTMHNIANDFHDYSTALYLFSFSSYLEVMLLGNFSKDYLDSVAKRVQEYQTYFRDQFAKCRAYIEKISSESIEMKAQEALGQAGKFLGNLIASSSLLSKGSADEWLVNSGNQLIEGKQERIASLVAQFDEQQDVGSELFVSNIQSVETVCNNTRAVLFDKDYLYLVS